MLAEKLVSAFFNLLAPNVGEAAGLSVGRDARLPRQGELLGALGAPARHAAQRGPAQANLGVGADVVVRADTVELARRQHHLVYVSE